MATTKADFRGLNRKIKRTKREIEKAGTATVQQLGEMGKAHARSIAPYYTGKTARLIKLFSGKRATGPYADIVSQNPTANDGHSRNMSKFNLVRWMHTSGKANNHIKSGDRRYMYSTSTWLRRNKISVAKGHFNKIKIR